jgi:hypothetical protein
MRADMAKVIVERPRFGHRLPSRKKGYRKYLQKTPIEDLPQRESLLGLWRGKGKWFSEHLSPMYRFLRSNLGRPWNKVHQELCEHVRFDNVVQKHVLTHVWDYVSINVEKTEEGIIARRDWGRAYQLSPGEMYVCPRSGILKEVKRSRSRRTVRRIGLGKLIQFHYRDGAWWELQMRPLTSTGDTTRRHSPRRTTARQNQNWDAWLERFIPTLNEEILTSTYGGKLLATSKRLLRQEEVAKLIRTARTK